MKKMMLTVLLGSGLVGCIHTEEVDQGHPHLATGQSEPPRASKTPPRQAPATPTSSPQARPAVEPGRPELAVSPEGIMTPEGPRMIQQALAERGYLPQEHKTGKLDKETSAAVRKFQADQEVAKTGVPDRETVRKLGLSVGNVFRSSKDD